jgi:hypothetical protein
VTLDLDALWFLLVGAVIVGSARALLSRLGSIEETLQSQGRKLVRIETVLSIKEHEQ